MAKRLTDTTIWGKTWFFNLPMRHKLLWCYILDNCDGCGVWDPNWDLAAAQIGEGVSLTEDDLSLFGDRVAILPNGDVFILDFIHFQYGNLMDTQGNPTKSRVHRSALDLLRKHGIAYPIDRVSVTPDRV